MQTLSFAEMFGVTEESLNGCTFLPCECSFVTGSRAYGPIINAPPAQAEEYASDIDVAILVPYINAFITALGNKAQDSDYFAGKKIALQNGRILNIIPLGSSDFVAWHMATQMMRNTKIAVTDREHRYCVFQLLVQSCKLINLSRSYVNTLDGAKAYATECINESDRLRNAIYL